MPRASADDKPSQAKEAPKLSRGGPREGSLLDFFTTTTSLLPAAPAQQEGSHDAPDGRDVYDRWVPAPTFCLSCLNMVNQLLPSPSVLVTT